MPPQNIYDNTEFYSSYVQLPRQKYGLSGAPEWPHIKALLPDLHENKLVDLGCGMGHFSRYARENGAARVLGIDVSENMISRAKASTSDEAIEIEHPIFLAPLQPSWVEDGSGKSSWSVNSYSNEGERTRNWFVEVGLNNH